MSYNYSLEDIYCAYKKLGVSKGRDVYAVIDLIGLMRYSNPNREVLLNDHLNVLLDLVGPTGTIFVPSASLNICNTKIIFDPLLTPSFGMGIFSEFVRCNQNSLRSFHPFWSLSGIGCHAENYLKNVSRHAYGYGSVWQKFIERDVLSLNIGKHPSRSVTVIHHLELISGVPYRYNKEFLHPVKRGEVIIEEPFYMNVLYKDLNIVRDKNRKIFKNFESNGLLSCVGIGNKGFGWSFSHKEFANVTLDLFHNDIYAWLETRPEHKLYRA
jgi:aminoglycoside 3-N-acetyltransferase